MNILPRSEEWPALVFAAIAAGIWTILSLLFLFTAEVWLDPSTVGGWLRILLLLPAVLSVVIGEAIFRAGVGLASVGIVFGAGVAALILGSMTLVALRRS